MKPLIKFLILILVIGVAFGVYAYFKTRSVNNHSSPGCSGDSVCVESRFGDY